MNKIPDMVMELFQMYLPDQHGTPEEQNKILRGSVDSLIHLVVGMMIANNLTIEKIEKLGDTLKGKHDKHPKH